MKKVLFAALGLLVLLLGAVLAAPQLVDWNAYKDEIAAQAERYTGRPLAIDGDLSLRLLPTPTLRVNKVRLANLAGGSEPEMARLESLNVRVALAPLLRLAVQVEEVTLVRPVILLERLADGRANWSFTRPGTEAGPPGAAAPAPEAGPAVSLERLAIEDGRVIYRDRASGSETGVEIRRALVSARSLEGPFEVQSSLLAAGLPLRIALTTGVVEPSRPTAVSGTVELGDDKARLELKGQLRPAGAAPGSQSGAGPDLEFAAGAVLVGANLREALAAAGLSAGAPSAALAQGFRLEGEVAITARTAAVNNLSGRIGGTRLTGAALVDFAAEPKADAALSLGQVNLDEWLGRASPAPAPGPGAAGEGGKGAAPGSQPGGFALPQGVSGTLDIAVDAVVYRGGLIRQGRLNVTLGQGVLAVNQAGALLPGGSDLGVFGFLSAEEGRPRFDGNVELASDNLRAVLDWLKIDLAGVAADRLRKVALTARLSGTPSEFQVTGLDLTVDSSRLTGGVAVALRERPAFGIGVKLDRVNLDSYLAGNASAAPAARAAGKGPAPEAAAAQGGAAPFLLKALEGFDANLQAEVGRMVVNGVEVAGAHLDGTLYGGRLTVRRVGARDLAGASAAMSGEIADLGGTPVFRDVKLTVRTGDARRLARLAGVEAALPAKVGGAFALDAGLSGGLNKLELQANAALAGARAALSGEIAAPAPSPHFNLRLEASHPDLARLADTLGWDYRPAARNLGGVSFAATVKGGPAKAALDGIRLALGPANVEGSAGIAFDGPRPRLTADLTASEVLLDLFLAAPESDKPSAAAGAPSPAPASDGRWPTGPIDLSALRALDGELLLKAVAMTYGKYRVDQPQLQATLGNGVLEVRRLDGTMFGGSFALSGRVSAPAGSGPPAVQASVAIKDAGVRQALFNVANVDLADGRLDLSLALSASGRSVFNLVSTLAGESRLEVRNGVIEGFDLDSVSERLKHVGDAVGLLNLLQTGMGGGKTRFTRFAGTFQVENGVVRTDDLTLAAKSGEGRAKGVVNLPRWTIDLNSTFRLTAHPEAPPFGMRTVGPLDSPRQVFDIKDLQAYLLASGVGALLRKVLPGARGGEAQPPAQPPPAAQPAAPAPEGGPSAEPPKRPRPEDILRGILGGFGK